MKYFNYYLNYPINAIKGSFFKIRMKLLDKFRKLIYDYEMNEVLNQKMEESYYEHPASQDLKVGILCPAIVVTKILEKHFGFNKLMRMRIHGIEVDTQSISAITVTIRLNSPGTLIGRGGCDIDAVENMLENYFNKKTEIRIVEIRKDVNMPLYIY